MRIPAKKLLGRIAIVSALALAASGAMTGCSSSAPAADAKTTITWWSWNPDNNTQPQWIAAFEKEHPNITVKARFLQYSDYVNALRLAATSSSGPDVFGLQTGALTTQMAPLTADLAPLAAKNIGSDWKDKLLATDQFVSGGKQVALPWMISGGGSIWYNKNIFDKAGITAAPTTLDEWKDDCTKITAIGVSCFVQGAKDDWVNLDVYQTIINEITPGTFYKALDGKAKFDSPDFVKAFSDWKQLFTDGIIQPGALGATQYPDANDLFNKGQAAMIAFGSWNNSQMTKTALAASAKTYGDQITSQVFLPADFPDVVGGAKETGRLFGGPDVGWAVSAKSAKKDAAFTFVQWLVSSQTAQSKMGATLELPALKSIPAKSDDLAAPDLQGPALTAQTKQLGNLIGPRQIANADVQTALSQALSSVASGQMSAADAAKSVQTAIDAAK